MADLFGALREGREGAQLERAFRILCFLLDAWCAYRGPRAQTAGEPTSECLRSIYFDKLAVMVARLWGTLHARRGRPSLAVPLDNSTLERLEGAVTFPFPFREAPGKHGRGLARWEHGGKPKYVVQLLFELSQEGILHYFRVDAHGSMPGDFRTEVRPGLPIADRGEFLKGFTPRETLVLEDLANVVRHLGPGGIRALGTHAAASKTAADIDREFLDLEKRAIWDRLLAALARGDNFEAPAEELLEYADEAWRKAVDNRSSYHEARRIVLQESRDDEVREAFKVCQPDAESIWGDMMVRRRAERAKRLHAAAGYTGALAHVQAHLGRSGASLKRDFQTFESSWHKLDLLGLSNGLPQAATAAVDPNPGEVKSSVRVALGSLLSQLRRPDDQ